MTRPMMDCLIAPSRPLTPSDGGLLHDISGMSNGDEFNDRGEGPTVGGSKADPAAPPTQAEAIPSWCFGSVAPRLEANGFQSIPISLPDPCEPNGGKKPAVANWREPRPVATRLRAFGRCGVGLLTDRNPAVDIDVRDPELADEIDRAVVALAGDAPVRFGAAPKRLRLFRTDSPFSKLATVEYVLPGDQPDNKLHRVEILCAGAQFVAFGIHPGTGRPYSWPFDSPLDLEWQDLPLLTEQMARRIIGMAHEMFCRAGGQARGRSLQKPRGRASASSLLRPRPARSLQEVDQVLRAIRSIDPNGLVYDAWVAVGYGLKAALPEHGLGVWLAWSRQSAKDRPDYTMKTWNGIRPTRCGWRYVLKLAGICHD
ncbi:MAG TPA: PriCT-2 domain-containing protein [Geminicoccus sp.]|jgi:hypothetical protein|uniref:PriCT-2 domain-containing protein n=1 Tax=Geminicoccus sp. TaxID=2024832 RepID=UPI002E348313|nr:PriCT-2 domain-containing protein [Geminicoccus sp.]HEX2527206.1 PriCT-2 domain-containing protein [Geminicoccus sp.]